MARTEGQIQIILRAAVLISCWEIAEILTDLGKIFEKKTDNSNTVSPKAVPV